MPINRITWLSCVIAGLAVSILAAAITPIFPTEGAGYAPGYGAPVYAFEMARTVEDLQLVFGTVDDPARASRIAAMDEGNRWDFAFMAAYGAFIAAFFVAAFHESNRAVWLLFAFLGVNAALADAVETRILLGLTADLEAAKSLELLAYPVWTKFLSIMVAGIAAGIYLMSRGQII